MKIGTHKMLYSVIHIQIQALRESSFTEKSS